MIRMVFKYVGWIILEAHYDRRHKQGLWRNTKWYFVLVEDLADNTVSTVSTSKWWRPESIRSQEKERYFEVMWRLLAGVFFFKCTESQVFRPICLL